MKYILVACVLAGLFPTLPMLGQDQPASVRQLSIGVGRTIRLQMSQKQRIQSVFNHRADVVRVQPVPTDPTTVLITGLMPGIARITLVGEDGQQEVHDIGKP
ncbi:MAG: hypothetical protein ACK4RK_08435 [Gemmataceae bacterium]